MLPDLEQQICDSVSKFNPNIVSKKAATRFLSRVDFHKSHHARLFAWLMTFDLISPSKPLAIASTVAQLHEKYLTTISNVFKDRDKPLADVDSADAGTIRADISRSVKWFKQLCTAAKVTEVPPNEVVILHAHRILAAISKLDSSLRYTQGYDRYMFVSYLLGLLFTTTAKLPLEVAESLSYHLTERMLRCVKTEDLLECKPPIEALNKRIDERVKIASPKIAQQLAEFEMTSYHYALRWQLLVFADEHQWDGITAIWDAVFVRREFWDDMIVELAVAHIEQVPVESEISVLERIQKFKKWDAEKLLRKAVEQYEKIHPPSTVNHIGLIFLIVAIVLVVGYLFIRK